MNFVTATTCSSFKALGPFRIDSSSPNVYRYDVVINVDSDGNQKFVEHNRMPVLELDLDSLFEDLYDVHVAKTVLNEPGEDVPFEQIRKELELD